MSVGDSVTLRVTASVDNIRWRHNGGGFIEKWNDDQVVQLTNVEVGDRGIYESHRNHDRSQGRHAIFQLIVRGNKHYNS